MNAEKPGLSDERRGEISCAVTCLAMLTTPEEWEVALGHLGSILEDLICEKREGKQQELVLEAFEATLQALRELTCEELTKHCEGCGEAFKGGWELCSSCLEDAKRHAENPYLDK